MCKSITCRVNRNKALSIHSVLFSNYELYLVLSYGYSAILEYKGNTCTSTFKIFCGDPHSYDALKIV